MEHSFGGAWSVKKLDILEKYLGFYCQALKRQPFRLHYVDAFAGTGIQSVEEGTEQLGLLPKEVILGSAAKALEIKPGFDEYHFNDLNPDHVSALRELSVRHPATKVRITQQDANSFVPEFCRKLGPRDRAVLFLDPYSTQLDWSTLEHVAKTGKIDLWLLFPISVIFRMTPKKEAQIRSEWNTTLCRLLGTEDWQSALYKPKEVPAIEDLFGNEAADELIERVNIPELQNWITSRLKEIFSYVAEPVPLLNRGVPLFSFYFAVANESEKAWRLADKVAKQIIKGS